MLNINLLTQICLRWRMFIVLSTVAGLAWSENCDENEEERARRLARKRKQRHRCTEDTATTHEVCGKLDEYEREGQQLMKQRKHIAISRTDHTRRSSNSSTNALPYLSLILGSLPLHMGNPAQKHVPSLLDMNLPLKVLPHNSLSLDNCSFSLHHYT